MADPPRPADFRRAQPTSAAPTPDTPTPAELAALWSSPALGAFIHRRLEQMMRFGHTPESDLAGPADRLARQALARINDVVEILGRDAMIVPPLRRAMLLRKVEIAGALLLATHDRLCAIPGTTRPDRQEHP